MNRRNGGARGADLGGFESLRDMCRWINYPSIPSGASGEVRRKWELELPGLIREYHATVRTVATAWIGDHHATCGGYSYSPGFVDGSVAGDDGAGAGGVEHGTDNGGTGFGGPANGSWRDQVGGAQCSGALIVGLPRGPNWARNKETRRKNKVRRAEAREKYVAEEAVRAYKERQKEIVENSSGGGSLAGNRVQVGWRGYRTPEEEELHKLRVERQIIQEKRKLEKLKSPTQIIEDAMRMVDFAQKCAKQQNDSKVAAWAAALSQASAESIAKSGSMPSVESLSSAKVKTVSSESSVSAGVSGGQDGSKAGQSSSGFATRGSRAAEKSTGYEEFVESKGSRVVVEDVDGSPLVLNKVPASKIVGSLAAGTAVTTEGRSIDSNGVAYTKTTALAWVRRYDSCIRKHASIAKSDEQIAKDAGLSVAEVKKYYRLRKEFSL